MTTPETCPTCRAPLAAGTPAASCPRCLLAASLPVSGGGEPEAFDDASARAAIGAQFPELELLEVVGRGGMGVVYRVRQKALDRIAALKVLPESLREEPGFAERFAREARTMARLDHPHIVRVHDFGERDGRFFLLMEYIDGASLRRVIDAGGLEPKEALRIVPQVCQALQYAHDAGVVHRDVKPGNVLIGKSGEVKVTDFGLAKLLDHDPADHTLTQAGQVMGTPHYMAPEQYRTPDDVDHRADIYSLGVVFYEMLTGEVPMGRFEAPSERVEVDVRLDGVVLRTLERERERRYQRVDELRTEVATIVDGPPERPVRSAPPAVPKPEPRLCRTALWGFLCAPALFVVPWLLAYLASDDGQMAWSVVMATALILLVVGFGLSLVGWIAIVRSRGALKGLGFAVFGTLVPLPMFLLAATMWFLLTRDVADEYADASGPSEIRSQPIRRHAAWDRFADALKDGVVSRAELRTIVADVDRQRVNLLRTEDRERLARDELLGPVYMPLEQVPADLETFERTSMEVTEGEVPIASLAMGVGDERLTVRLLQDDGYWTFALAPVLRVPSPQQWSLADLVRGPFSSALEQRATQTEVEVLWSIYRRLWEAGDLPARSRIPAAHLPWLLAPSYLQTLDPTGTSALAEDGKDGARGLLFLDGDALPRPLADYTLASIEVLSGGKRARVTARASQSSITFVVRRERGRWWFAAEPTSIAGR